MAKDKTFVKITNQQIYEKVCEIADHQIKTNGRVKLNRWIGTTALSLVVALVFGLLGTRLL